MYVRFLVVGWRVGFCEVKVIIVSSVSNGFQVYIVTLCFLIFTNRRE